MRFDRFPKHQDYSVTPRRVAAARRAVQADRDRCGLFPEMVVHSTPEERLQALALHRCQYWQDQRDHVGRLWREARRAMAKLPPVTRSGVRRYWQECSYPGHPVYLLGLIHEAQKGRSAWAMLARKRRLWLIGQGRLPKAVCFRHF